MNTNFSPFLLHTRSHQPNAFPDEACYVKNEIKKVALREGILLDLIYSAKLFLNAREIIKKKQLKGNKLIIHSGGALALSGFL